MSHEYRHDIAIDRDLCIKCGACARSCGTGFLRKSFAPWGGHLLRLWRRNADLLHQHIAGKACFKRKPPDVVFQLHRLLDIAQECCAGLGIFRAALLGAHVVLLLLAEHAVLHSRDGL